MPVELAGELSWQRMDEPAWLTQVRSGATADRRLRCVDTTAALVSAIQGCRIIRLAYRRQRDEVISLHYVAPVDIRVGVTDATKGRTYLWAYCFDENRLERHLLDRIVSVTASDEAFSPREILSKWPEGWLIPDEWTVPRGEEHPWLVT